MAMTRTNVSSFFFFVFFSVVGRFAGRPKFAAGVCVEKNSTYGLNIQEQQHQQMEQPQGIHILFHAGMENPFASVAMNARRH